MKTKLILLIIVQSVLFGNLLYSQEKKIITENQIKSELQNENGNFIIDISNQSFLKKTIDVEVYIDNILVIRQKLHVNNQHTYYTYVFKITEGIHVIKVATHDNRMVLTKRLKVTRKKLYVYINYNCDENKVFEYNFNDSFLILFSNEELLKM